MSSRLKTAVLLSGRGSNLAALIDAARADLPIDLVGVFSDRADAPGLALAQSAQIPTAVYLPRDYADKASFEAALFAAVAATGADLVVLAGFMRVLSATSVDSWCGRMINIHPSLLPAYQGLHTHARAIAAGEREHGASVHFVTPVLDGGPVLMQTALAILPDDSAERLAARLLPLEHRLLVASVGLLAAGRVRLTAAGIAMDGQLLTAPLRLESTV